MSFVNILMLVQATSLIYNISQLPNTIMREEVMILTYLMQLIVGIILLYYIL